MKSRKRFYALAVSVILLAFAASAWADIYWESDQVTSGQGWPTRKKVVRNYVTPDCSRMDIGENVMIADFKSMTGYVLNTNDKNFLKMDMGSVGKIPDELREEIQVTPTGQQRRISGYNCLRYKVKYMGREYDEWLSRDVDGYQELKSINDKLYTLIRNNPLFQMGIVGKMHKLDGFPVQSVMRFEDGRTKTVTLRRVVRKPLDYSIFKVPPGYKPPY